MASEREALEEAKEVLDLRGWEHDIVVVGIQIRYRGGAWGSRPEAAPGCEVLVTGDPRSKFAENLYPDLREKPLT